MGDELRALHRWDLTPAQAVQVQRELRPLVRIFSDDTDPLRPAGTEWDAEGLPILVAGVDVSYGKFDTRCYAVVAVWNRPEKRVVEMVTAVGSTDFAYVPGLLSFRELPILFEAIAKMRSAPGVFVVDGQGIAHPRGIGVGTHLGLWLEKPVVGCAKSRLCGRFTAPGPIRGDTSDLTLPDEGGRAEKIGTVVRTKTNTKPLFVSPGHLCSHAFAVRLVLGCGTKYRLPDPTREADMETKRLRLAITGAPDAPDADGPEN